MTKIWIWHILRTLGQNFPTLVLRIFWKILLRIHPCFLKKKLLLSYKNWDILRSCERVYPHELPHPDFNVYARVRVHSHVHVTTHDYITHHVDFNKGVRKISDHLPDWPGTQVNRHGVDKDHTSLLRKNCECLNQNF